MSSLARRAGLALLAVAPAALAERTLEFASPELPRAGVLILAVGSDGLGGPVEAFGVRLLAQLVRDHYESNGPGARGSRWRASRCAPATR